MISTLQVVLDGRERVAGRSGLVYGLDLAGSCVGALVGGSILIPALGLAHTCYAVSLAMVVCAGAVFLAVVVGADGPSARSSDSADGPGHVEDSQVLS